MVSTFEGNKQPAVNDRVEGRSPTDGGFNAANAEIQSGLKNFSDIQGNMKGPDTSNLQSLQLFDSSQKSDSGDGVQVADASSALKGGDRVASDAPIKPDTSAQIKDASEALDPRLTPVNGANALKDSLTDARGKFGKGQQGFNDQFVKQLGKELDDSPQVKAKGNSIEFRGLDQDGVRATFDKDNKAQLSTFNLRTGGPSDSSPQDVIDKWNRKKLSN